MEIRTNKEYQEALNRRADLMKAYSHLGDPKADSLDAQISEVDAAILKYERSMVMGEEIKIPPYFDRGNDGAIRLVTCQHNDFGQVETNRLHLSEKQAQGLLSELQALIKKD